LHDSNIELGHRQSPQLGVMVGAALTGMGELHFNAFFLPTVSKLLMVSAPIIANFDPSQRIVAALSLSLLDQ
jgi:hypothetical protein